MESNIEKASQDLVEAVETIIFEETSNRSAVILAAGNEDVIITEVIKNALEILISKEIFLQYYNFNEYNAEFLKRTNNFANPNFILEQLFKEIDSLISTNSTSQSGNIISGIVLHHYEHAYLEKGEEFFKKILMVLTDFSRTHFIRHSKTKKYPCIVVFTFRIDEDLRSFKSKYSNFIEHLRSVIECTNT